MFKQEPQLTARGDGDEDDTGCNHRLPLPTHLIRVKEEYSGPSCDKFTKPGPNEVQGTRQHNTGGVTGHRLQNKRSQYPGLNLAISVEKLLTVGRRMLLSQKISNPAITELMIERLIILKGLISSSSNKPLSVDSS